MHLQIVDNVERNTASILAPAIEAANDIRIAVAFVSSDGLSQIMPSVRKALDAGAYVEFLVGMDVHATDPIAIRELYALSREHLQASLLCFVSPRTSAIYHPKMYLTRDSLTATAIIGSSNLTRRGLTSNIEANVVIKDDVCAEIISEIFSTYNRLKYHPDRVIPDDEFIDLFARLYKQEKIRERQLAQETDLKKLHKQFLEKATTLQRPKRVRKDLIGWMELVYDALPEGRFTNQYLYQYENRFREHYPQNLNIRAKIRQQLQLLHKLGFIEHISPGTWKKVE